MGRGETKKRSRFTEEQITYALRLADSGTPVVDVCHDNARLRRIVADLTLDKQILQELVMLQREGRNVGNTKYA